MSTAITFQGPPSSQKNATLYQHAQETMRFVREAKGILESYDNKDKVDLNSDKGTLVMGSTQPVDLRHNLAGAYSQPALTGIKGQIVDGKVEATLTGSGYYDTCKVSYQETPTEILYSVEAAPQAQYHFYPGALKVSQDKASGALSLEQQEEFPWQLNFEPGTVEMEKHFGPSGPTSVEDTRFYRSGEQLQAGIDAEIASLRSLENGPRDLNPDAGVVVAAAFKSQDSDNLVYGHMAGNYTIPTEAAVHFDPHTGEVSEYTRGFGSHETLSYHRQGDTQVYERKAFLGCDRLEVKADGSRFQQHFKEAAMDQVDPTVYQQERTIKTSLLPRVFDSANAARTLGWSAAAGALAGTLVGVLTPGSLGVSIAAGLLGAAATASVVNTVPVRGVELPVGVNRFEGSDRESRFANASKAYEHMTVAGGRDPYTRESFDLGEAGASREKCIEMFNSLDTGYYDRLAILTQSLGQQGDPAVVVVVKDFHYPIRIEDQGLLLPGGATIPYSSIRAVSELS